MTHTEAMARVLARSEIQIKTDKAGRQFAQYFCRPANRWIRVGLVEAQFALAQQEA
jgi:hypothetical protein